VPQPAPHDQQQPAGWPASPRAIGGQPAPQQQQPQQPQQQAQHLESELQQLLGPGYAATIAEKGLSVGHMAALYADLRQQAAARRQQATAQDAAWPGADSAAPAAGRLQRPAPAAAAAPPPPPPPPPGRSALAQAVEDLRLPGPAYADLDPPPPRFTSTTASGSLLGTPQGPTPTPPSRPLTAQQRRPPSAPPPPAAAAAAPAAPPGEEGPSRAELLRMLADYEGAYECVKERLEVQYRHELGRAEHLQARLGERDAQLVAAQEEAHALRRCVGSCAGAGPAAGEGGGCRLVVAGAPRAACVAAPRRR
jgi:hypothetical protein